MLVIKLTVIKVACVPRVLSAKWTNRDRKNDCLVRTAARTRTQLSNVSLSPTNLRLDKQKKLASCVIMLSRHKQGASELIVL